MWISLLGVAALIGIAVIFSNNRRAINLRVVAPAFLLQAAMASFALWLPFGQHVLQATSGAVQVVINFANEGSDFVFGDLSNGSLGFIFAFKVLPVIVFVASLTSVLYYLRIMQAIVVVLGGALRFIIGTSRVESLNAAGNIFLGQTESPLLVKPYLAGLSDRQLFTVMVSGLASVSGAILVGYSALGVELKYLITASFMSAPGGLLMAKLLYPDIKEPDEVDIHQGDAHPEEGGPTNVIEAAANGAADGVRLALNIGGMLIAFVALIAMVNGILGGVGHLIGQDGWSLNAVLGAIFSPLMYLLGIPWSEAGAAGDLVGQKLILNEFVAYASLQPQLQDLSPHTVAVVTFALCGFANLSSLAILLGGLGGLVPERKSDIARLGLRAVLAGSLSNLMSAALASFMLGM